MITRIIGWLSVTLATLVVAWFALNRLSDAPISPEHRALARSADAIPDSSNVAVGILGLTAPKGLDFVAYGTEIKALYETDAPHEQIRQRIRGPNTLQPTVDGTQAICWLDPAWTTFKDCLPFDKAPAVLQDNKELLERYKTLYELGQYEATDIYYNEAFLVLVRLVVAEMHLDLQRGDHEGAYQKWYRQTRFAKDNLRATDTWVGKAIGLVAIGMTIPLLDSLLMANPGTAKVHRAQLEEILRPDGIAAFNPDGIARAEFRMLRKAMNRPPAEVQGYAVDKLDWLAFYLGQKNRVLNRYAAFAPEYASALRGPWSEVEKTSAQLRDRYIFSSDLELVLDPFGSVLSARFIDGQLRASQMVKQMHFVDERFRLATLVVRILSERIPDAGIPALLASDPRFFDPFSSTPARWDPKDRKVYFVDPTDKCTVATWFRVRDTKRPPKKSSVVDTSAC